VSNEESGAETEREQAKEFKDAEDFENLLHFSVFKFFALNSPPSS